MPRTVLSISVALLLLAGALAAQPAPPEIPPEVVLKLVLDLSDDQLRSIVELRQRRQEALEPLGAQMRELQRAFQQAIHSGSSDATKLGELILAMRALGQQFEQQEKTYRDAVAALLTPEQRERVSAIHGIEMAVHAAGALRAFGL